jgi:hypothetical protein
MNGLAMEVDLASVLWRPQALIAPTPGRFNKKRRSPAGAPESAWLNAWAGRDAAWAWGTAVI